MCSILRNVSTRIIYCQSPQYVGVYAESLAFESWGSRGGARCAICCLSSSLFASTLSESRAGVCRKIQLTFVGHPDGPQGAEGGLAEGNASSPCRRSLRCAAQVRSGVSRQCGSAPVGVVSGSVHRPLPIERGQSTWYLSDFSM